MGNLLEPISHGFKIFILPILSLILASSSAIPNHLNKITGFLPEDGKDHHLPLGEPRVAGLLEPCPSGCCPFASWFCCEDNRSCAQTMEDCPLVSGLERRIEVVADIRTDLEPCPSGCCPFAGWYCCDNNRLCAITPEDCI